MSTRKLFASATMLLITSTFLALFPLVAFAQGTSASERNPVDSAAPAAVAISPSQDQVGITVETVPLSITLKADETRSVFVIARNTSAITRTGTIPYSLPSSLVAKTVNEEPGAIEPGGDAVWRLDITAKKTFQADESAIIQVSMDSGSGMQDNSIITKLDVLLAEDLQTSLPMSLTLNHPVTIARSAPASMSIVVENDSAFTLTLGDWTIEPSSLFTTEAGPTTHASIAPYSSVVLPFSLSPRDAARLGEYTLVLHMPFTYTNAQQRVVSISRTVSANVLVTSPTANSIASLIAMAGLPATMTFPILYGFLGLITIVAAESCSIKRNEKKKRQNKAFGQLIDRLNQLAGQLSSQANTQKELANTLDASTSVDAHILAKAKSLVNDATAAQTNAALLQDEVDKIDYGIMRNAKENNTPPMASIPFILAGLGVLFLLAFSLLSAIIGFAVANFVVSKVPYATEQSLMYGGPDSTCAHILAAIGTIALSLAIWGSMGKSVKQAARNVFEFVNSITK